MKIQRIDDVPAIADDAPMVVEPEALAPDAPTAKTEADTFEIIEDDEDGSISFQLTDGTPVKFREMIGDDVSRVERFGAKNPGSNMLAVLYLVTILCVKWGDKDKVTLDELRQKPTKRFGRDYARLAKAIEFFRVADLAPEQ